MRGAISLRERSRGTGFARCHDWRCHVRRQPDDRDDGDSDQQNAPSLSFFLLSDTRLAWALVCARAYLGCAWLLSGISLQQEVIWFRAEDQVTSLNAAAPADVLRLQPFAPILLGTGELVIGILLILGAFTGLTAFISVFLSVNPLDPGPATADPLAFALTMLVILAWRISGWYGLDRWLLREAPATQARPTNDLSGRKRR